MFNTCCKIEVEIQKQLLYHILHFIHQRKQFERYINKLVHYHINVNYIIQITTYKFYRQCYVYIYIQLI